MIDGQLITSALRRGVSQLGDLRILGVLALSIGLMLLVTAPFAAIFIGVTWIIELITPQSLHLPWVGDISFLGVFTEGLVSRSSWIFWTYVMTPVAGGIIGLFLDRIVATVEARYYPDLPQPQVRPFSDALFYALRFFGLLALVSLGALIASFFAGFLAPLVFIAANGYLLAREYFETAALRRLTETDAQLLAKSNQATLWALGAILALGLSVPFLNLLIPVLGVAAFTHAFHGLTGADIR